jgi:hypothetical protein
MRVGAAVAKMRVALADLAAGSPSRRPIDPGRGEFFCLGKPGEIGLRVEEDRASSMRPP